MDKESDYDSGDSRFESWRGRLFILRKEVMLTQIIMGDQMVINKDKQKKSNLLNNNFQKRACKEQLLSLIFSDQSV